MEATPITNLTDPVSESRITQETAKPIAAQSVAKVNKEVVSKVKEDSKENAASASSEELAGIIAEDMNEVARVLNTSLNFSVDKPTGRTVIKVIDKETKETIRQLPPEDMLNLMSKMKNMMGMLLDVEV